MTEGQKSLIPRVAKIAEPNVSTDSFKLWKVPELKDCRKRGISVVGKKEELVALCYALTLQNAPVVGSKEEERAAVARDYNGLPEFTVEGHAVKIPDPLKLNGWESEDESVCKWPPCMNLNISNYLVAEDQRNLLTRLRNDYKEGWYQSTCCQQ